MEAEKIRVDVTEALAEIAKLRGGLGDVTKEIAKVRKGSEDAFDEGFALGMVDAIDDLEKEYKELKRAADVLKNALKGATDPALVKTYTANVASLEAGMKRLEVAGKKAGVSLRDAGKGAKQAGKDASDTQQVFEGLFGTFTKVTIILAAVEAVRSFASAALQNAESVKKASLQFEAFLGTASEAEAMVARLREFSDQKIIESASAFEAGKALLAFGESADNVIPVLSRIADISRATGKDFNELAVIYGKARAAGTLYAEDINQLLDAGIPILGELAKQLGVNADQVKKLASEGRISFEELQLAFFNLTAEGGRFAGQAEAAVTAGDRFSAAWDKALTKVGVTLKPVWDGILNNLTALIDNVAKIGDAKGFTEFSARTLSAIAKVVPGLSVLEKSLLALTRRGGQQGAFFDVPAVAETEELAEQIAERERLEKAAEARRKQGKKLTAQELAAIEKERSRLTLEAMAEGEAKEVAREQMRFAALKKELQKYHIDTAQAEEQHQLNLTAIELRFALKRNAEADRLNQLRQAEDAFERAAAQQRKKDALAQLNAVKDLRESEVDITERELENLLSVLRAGGASKERIAEAEQDFSDQIKVARLKSEIDFQQKLLIIQADGDETQIALIRNRIQALQTELDGIGIRPRAQGDTREKGLLELLGIEVDNEQLQALEQAANAIKSIVNDVTATIVASAEQEVRAAQMRVDSARSAYDAQRDLNEQGFANNLEAAERNLEAAKAQEEAAIAQRRKAVRAQQTLDTVSQVSSLVTASAQTLKSFPGPLLPIGIAIIAAMFAAFIAAKARARQASKFRHGGEGRITNEGFVVGPSHESGGVPIEVEGGETFSSDGKRFAVVNKRMTAKHFDLLKAVNTDNRAAMIAALEGLTGRVDRASTLSATGGGAMVGGSGVLDQIRDNTARHIFVENGYRVTVNGRNVKRTKIA